MTENSLNIDYNSSLSRYSALAESHDSARLFYNKKIWRVKDVARFLDCSVGHIYNLVSDEKIPKIKKGKFVYFIPDDILSWVLEGDVT
ncbi:MAG: helix-turn-helix domain-containing protein [Bdellovibrio sp.]|nr:helix-turn-helix domain-containing protein [Bdellovibrio sp.]